LVIIAYMYRDAWAENV